MFDLFCRRRSDVNGVSIADCMDNVFTRFQLWEKEGLLDYQEESLIDSEDQEVQMTLYINQLAVQLRSLNLTLPPGLREQPYYSM